MSILKYFRGSRSNKSSPAERNRAFQAFLDSNERPNTRKNIVPWKMPRKMPRWFRRLFTRNRPLTAEEQKEWNAMGSNRFDPFAIGTHGPAVQVVPDPFDPMSDPFANHVHAPPLPVGPDPFAGGRRTRRKIKARKL
jgi:hypothetical protein